MADQGSEGLLSPYLRRKRVKAVVPYLKGNVLDFGCGSGALAKLIEESQYLGVEIDSKSLCQARLHFPKHHFTSNLPQEANKFDTIVLLAVIEHVKDPAQFLLKLTAHLNNSSKSRLVLTTPAPFIDIIHSIGASIGLFSKHANEEHEELLNRDKLENIGKKAGLTLISYKRFLFGANQIAIFAKEN